MYGAQDFVMMDGVTFDSPTSPPARGQAVPSGHVHVRCEETAEGTVAVSLSTTFVPPAAPTLHARPEAGSLGLRRTAGEAASAAQQPDEAEAPEAARIEAAAEVAAEAAEQPDEAAAEAEEAARIEAATEAAERSSDEAVSPSLDLLDNGTEAAPFEETVRPTPTLRPVEPTTAAAEAAEAALVWMEPDGGGETKDTSLTLERGDGVDKSFDAIICREALAEQTATAAERETERELERSLSPSGGNDYLEHSDLADAGNAIVSPSFLEEAAASCIQEAYREHRLRLSDASPVRSRNALGDNADEEGGEENSSERAEDRQHSREEDVEGGHEAAKEQEHGGSSEVA